ncbi:MAG: D-glycero-beta-D-manno-heptose 1-phosphate adenylyltransferase [Planctomycetes bacterium]|jgi:D-beta-D-heptose 7-phosphate kinase/D-beta-D-heptose 1-phosphate adenosyltransferase|nr:D-glycero-beta-D-manno-heptose 1-phosphate adenylyltransferase [Planctomycetota bacterium]
MIHTSGELLSAVEAFGSPRILVIGDLILDQYVYGDAERLSPEAPVPVVRERYRHTRVGGAANVAVFLAAMGARPVLTGVCGDDPSGRSLQDLLTQAHVDTTSIITLPQRPTSTKTRFIGLAQHRHQQQMLRLDHETLEPVDNEAEKRLLAVLEAEMASCHLVCLEDYNKGLFSEALCQKIISIARAAGRDVLVDPAAIKDYQRYYGATAITPNRTEAELATAIRMDNVHQEAPQLAAQLLEQLNLEICVLTLDRHGMYRLERGQPGMLHATRPRHVYDVTGAGDMVLAMLAMARANGTSWSVAMDLGNIVGGLEVEKFGCVPIPRSEIIEELQQLDSGGTRKIVSLPRLLERLHSHHREQKIVFTNGVFDILHAGHVRYLNFARTQGDLLVVGVNSDASVRRLKGADRPINTLEDRMAILAALESVSYVIAFEADTPLELIAAITPAILVKGADYQDKPVVGRECVEAAGGQVVLAPFLAGRSTSRIVEKMRTHG